MKKLFTLLAIASFGFSYGQECVDQKEPNFGSDEASCKKYVSLYTEPLKQKDYHEAALNWWKAHSFCPAYKTNFYKNGVYIYKKLIKAETDKAAKTAKADTLYMIYDEWMKNLGECCGIQKKYATDIMMYKSSDYEKAYGLFVKAEACDINSMKHTQVQQYMKATYTMVKNGKAECDVLLEKYDKLASVCEKNTKEGVEKYREKYSKAIEYLDKLVAPCASCDKLEELFKPKFEADPENIDLMKKIVNMMGGRKCTDSDFYFDVVVKLHDKEPSFTSAKGIAMKYYNEGKTKDAAKYLDQALTLTEDEAEKAKLYPYLMSVYSKQGKWNDAIKYAGMIGSSEKNATTARAVASKANSCGADNTERSFAYCLALDYAEKAGGKVSSKEISAWKGRLSTEQDIFFKGLTVGQEVTVPCWKNEKTKLRAK